LQALEVKSMPRPPLSIIIPSFNAMPRLADCLGALVEGLSAGLVREAIVVDGSSDDSSAALAADMGCKVVVLAPKARGRGNQLRAGAAAAAGEWLLFLHADTVLQAGWVGAVADHMNSNADQAGFFKLAFDVASPGAARVAGLANLRAKAWGLPYGDAGLLISRNLYDAIGGYGAMPLMEDVDIVRRLGRARLVALDSVAQTSAAKYERGGWWSVPARNLMLLGAYHLGVKPEILAGWYK
jgi:rSAM/selenodomain-associated transferase 2